MKKYVDSDHLSFNCPIGLDHLENSNDGLFCQKCSRKIHDLQDCTIGEVKAIQKREGRICGIVRIAAMSTIAGVSACDNTTKVDSEIEVIIPKIEPVAKEVKTDKKSLAPSKPNLSEPMPESGIAIGPTIDFSSDEWKGEVDRMKESKASPAEQTAGEELR